tara:strand:- start:1396 stop:1983 length:588 start_codon:yes stop_codon:yes gene_type:complete
MATQQGSGFWADAYTEPKRKYRFLLNFRGIDQWIIKNVNKPSFDVSESEHDFLNYKFYFPGRVTWNSITVTLVDPVQPDASKTIQKLLNDSGYVEPSDVNVESGNPITISKEKAIQALGNKIYIKQVDPDGRGPIEQWELNNPWIKSVSFGDLDYSADDLVEITMEIRYDWARCLNVGPGKIAQGARGPMPRRRS